jgi:hypothetical protein
MVRHVSFGSVVSQPAISVWPKITVMGPKNENAMAGHVYARVV